MSDPVKSIFGPDFREASLAEQIEFLRPDRPEPNHLRTPGQALSLEPVSDVEMSIDNTTTPPSLIVMGTPTAQDDLMIAAIAQGKAEGETARTGQGSTEPIISLETVRLIARRAFNAGVGRHGYCEYDCQFEIGEIIAKAVADQEDDRRFLEDSGEAA